MGDFDLQNIIQTLEFINSLKYGDNLKIGGDYMKYQGRNVEDSLLKIHYINEKGNKCFTCFGFNDIDKEQFKRIDFDEEIERIKKIKEIFNS